jgi:predicted metal-dependent enzyme (double-stranded beta helix superfamily)
MKFAYKPFSLLFGVVGGIVAGAAVKQVWRIVSGEDDTPDATDEDRSWGEVLAAAAVQGAVFALVKAAFDRAGATGVKKLTGSWPG